MDDASPTYMARDYTNLGALLRQSLVPEIDRVLTNALRVSNRPENVYMEFPNSQLGEELSRVIPTLLLHAHTLQHSTDTLTPELAALREKFPPLDGDTMPMATRVQLLPVPAHLYKTWLEKARDGGTLLAKPGIHIEGPNIAPWLEALKIYLEEAPEQDLLDILGEYKTLHLMQGFKAATTPIPQR